MRKKELMDLIEKQNKEIAELKSQLLNANNRTEELEYEVSNLTDINIELTEDKEDLEACINSDY